MKIRAPFLSRSAVRLSWVCLALAGGIARADERPPWDGPSFSAKPADLLAAAAQQRVSADHASVVLFEENEFRFDADRRETWRFREVIKILQPSGVESWSSMEYDWSPWHQNKPEIRARVIAPDGRERRLDPSTIAEAPAGPSTGDVYSDSRQVRAALPAVEVGAIIEEEVVISESRPFFEPGMLGYAYFGAFVPVVQSRLTVSFPSSFHFSRRVHDLPDVLSRTTEGEGRTTWTFDEGLLAPVPVPESNRPSDVPPQPFIAFSTAGSWKEVAAAYAAVVEEGLRGAELHPLVDPLVAGSRDPREITDRLYHWISANVRYTGIEFGQSAIVPHSPSETISRKYGDCKDKAILLVAMLKTAGVPATVALLNADAVMDVDPELPGINGFDHAIVYVPGPPAIWIDPTDEFGRAGGIPAADQGRRALVIESAVSDLTRTPLAPAESNPDVVRYEIRLADQGKATVRYSEEVGGELERSYRSSFRNAAPEKMREKLSEVIRRELSADKIVSLQSTRPEDFSAPFRVEFEVAGAGRGHTEDFSAAASLPIGGVCGNLPEELRQEDGDGPDRPAEKEPGAAAGRKFPFIVKAPSVTTYAFHVVPPPGFVSAALPPSASTPIGPAKLAETYENAPDGSVTATFRLDGIPRRLSVTEYHQTRKDFTKFASRSVPLLNFQLAAARRFAAGELAGALHDFRATASKDPTSAMNAARLAQALAEAGAGDAARREADRAVRLDPRSAVVRRAQGRVRARDLLGRQYHPGFDRRGAIAAYRKALEIDKDDDAGRAELALVLEHDETGERYSKDADLEGALAQYEDLADRRKNHKTDDNMLIDLLRLGRFDAVLARISGMERTPNRDAYRLAAVAVNKGIAEAISLSAVISPVPAERSKALAVSGQLLMTLRRYPPAAALLSESAKGADNAEQLLAAASLAEKARRHEDVARRPGDPVAAVQRMYSALLLGEAANFRACFTADAARDLFPEDDPARWNRLFASFRKIARQQQVSSDVLADTVLGKLEWNAEGDDNVGYRVVPRTPNTKAGHGEAYFVRREAAGYRIAATNDGSSLLGLEALAAADRNDLPAAHRWLDWAREEITPPGGDDPASGSAFPRLWSRGEAADASRIRLAAAALLADGSAAEKAIPILEQARKGEHPPATRLAIDLALLRADAHAGRDAEALSLGDRLGQEYPASDAIFEARALARYRLNRLEELEAIARKRLAAEPDDPTTLRTLSETLATAGRFEESRKVGRRLIDLGRATSMDYNNIAWSALGTDRVADEDIEYAREAARLAPGSKAPALNTLAALYAARGKCLEARQAALQAMDEDGRESPEGMDWLVFARVLEEYGELGDARIAYRKIERGKTGSSSNSVYALAQIALHRLDPAAKSPAS